MSDRRPDPDKVICPNCVHEFAAIPENVQKRLSALVDTTVDKSGQGSDTPVMAGMYGYCPVCKAKGNIRERRPDGNDHCVNGHTYPSREALNTPTGMPPSA